MLGLYFINKWKKEQSLKYQWQFLLYTISDSVWFFFGFFLELSEFLVTGFSYYCRHVLYHREVTWCLRALVRTHRTLNTTSCSHRVAFVCPAGINYYKKFTSSCCLRVWFGCHRVTFCWHRTCFRCSLAVDQVRGHLRAKFKTPYSHGHLVSISGQCDASNIVILGVIKTTSLIFSSLPICRGLRDL